MKRILLYLSPSRAWCALKKDYPKFDEAYQGSKLIYEKYFKEDIPPSKLLNSLRSSKARALGALSRVRSFKRFLLEGVPRYIKSNRLTLARYLFVYALIWSQEPAMGFTQEYFLVLALGTLVLFDFFALRVKLGGGAYTSLLRRKGLLRRKRSAFQRATLAFFLSFTSNTKRFISNPVFRLSKLEALRFVAPMWFVAFA